MILCFGFSLGGCGVSGEDSNQSEYAYMVGDLMSAFDDALVSGGVLTLAQPARKAVFSNFLPASIFDKAAAEPLATSCDDVALSTCATGSGNGLQSRSYNGCTNNSLTFSGDVNYIHSGVDCVLSPAESVDRTPNFTVTGRRGYSLYVYGESPAQTITRTGANAYTFSSGAITRAFTDTEGTTVLEFSSQTSSDLTITKSSTGRTVTGGELQVSNLDGTESCALTPTSVKWDTTSCRCPVSGYWSGTCDGGNVKIKFDGCGVAEFTYDDTETTLNLDRCF